jgi:LAO/AO transport system kinase
MASSTEEGLSAWKGMSASKSTDDELVRRFKKGHLRALARMITLVENEAPGYRRLLSEIYGDTGRAKKIGITGATGAGKSTLVDELTKLLVAKGHSVGIVAVDPTSPFTGGALLGDRVRMQDVGLQKNVYIRSMASRGSLGGVARATREVSIVLDAFGKDFILIESVGVGQVALDIAEIVDTTVVVLVPESGDSIQTMKAGLMEIADIFVINKADLVGADRLEMELEGHLEFQRKRDGWEYPVIKIQARKGQGIDELFKQIDRQEEYLAKTGYLMKKKKELVRAEILQLLSETVRRRVQQRLDADGNLDAAIADIMKGRLDPYQAVDQLLERLRGAGSND